MPAIGSARAAVGAWAPAGRSIGSNDAGQRPRRQSYRFRPSGSKYRLGAGGPISLVDRRKRCWNVGGCVGAWVSADRPNVAPPADLPPVAEVTESATGDKPSRLKPQSTSVPTEPRQTYGRDRCLKEASEQPGGAGCSKNGRSGSAALDRRREVSGRAIAADVDPLGPTAYGTAAEICPKPRPRQLAPRRRTRERAKAKRSTRSSRRD